MKDYYQVLGVPRDAKPEDIKNAFRALAKKYHPDKNAGNRKSEERFKEVNEAYAVLSDPEKRRQYDTFGAEGFSQRFSQEDIFRNFDFRSVFTDVFGGAGFGDSILSQIFGDFGRGKGARSGKRGVRFESGPGQGFGQEFGGQGFGSQGFGQGFGQGFAGQGFGGQGFGSTRAGVPGQDAEAAISISLEEAHAGGKRRVSLHGPDGRQMDLEVRIPPGIRPGRKMRLAGKGAASPAGGQPGDLYLLVDFAPHPVFEVEGDDLVTHVHVPVSTLALGGTVEVPTLDGPARTLAVKPGTQGGARVRIRGYGLSVARGGRGDIHVVLDAAVPEKISKEQKKLFEQLRDAGA